MELAQIIAKLPHVCSVIRGKLMESKTMRARERHLADEHLVNVARSGAGIGSAWAGARRGGSPYPHAPAKTTLQAKDGAGNKEILRMREVVFRLEAERPGHLEARAETLPIRITAPTLEDLQHEAREALIAHMGPAHCTFRVRVRRGPPAAVSSIRPVGRPAALCR